MSISAAVTEINNSEASAAYRHLRDFRALQHALDGLIGEVEGLVRDGALAVPEQLRRRAGLALARVHGRAPEWLCRVTAPSAFLDHLFVAEGSLRQKYYVGVDLDLDDRHS